jgi:1-deoxy-D-xylulose-5-phosphate reductoisomerase
LEVIEARWLFGFDADHISVIVHPQSVVHSMIELVDGSIVAQLGVTDMKHAIQYALTYPDRRENCLAPLDFAQLSELQFESPDTERFPCLDLAYEALRRGGTTPAALNAANEVAVAAFLDGKIRIPDIARTNAAVIEAHAMKPADSLDAVLEADRDARRQAESLLASSKAAS